MATMEEILTGSADKTVEPEADPKEEKPEQEAAAETPEQKPEEEPQEEASVSAEEEVPKGEEKAAPPAAEKTEPNAPIAALLDERDKRQKLERELEELKKSQKPDEETDFFEDPEGALKSRDRQFDEKLLQTKLQMSEAMVKDNHTDFDEVMGKFNKAMEADPSLRGRAKIIWDDALAQPHPALAIYKAVQRELVVQEISDPDEYRKKIEAEVRAELAKEKEDPEKPAEEKPAPSIPESLADERSVGSRKGPEWAGPTPLGEIIKSA